MMAVCRANIVFVFYFYALRYSCFNLQTVIGCTCCGDKFVVDRGLICLAVKVYEWTRETFLSSCCCLS